MAIRDQQYRCGDGESMRLRVGGRIAAAFQELIVKELFPSLLMVDYAHRVDHRDKNCDEGSR